jgi:branched-chain amino acid transport system substrate-binding protein
MRRADRDWGIRVHKPEGDVYVSLHIRMWLILGGLVAGLAFAAAGAGAQPETIKIVSSLPRTGNSKAQTDSIVNSIRMALDEAGHRVAGFNLLYEDLDDATPERGAWDAVKEAENANKAVADADVMVYLGTFNSGAAKVAIPILNRASLVMISPANTYPGLTKPGTGEPNEPDIYYPSGKRNYTRVTPADDVQGAVAANWAKQLGVTKVYVLDDTELYGHGIAIVFAETARKIGLNVVGGPEGINPKASDYRALATKVRGAAPELVFYGGITQNNAGKLVKDLRAVLGPDVMLMGPDGIYEQAFLDDAGDAAEGMYITFGGVAPSKLTGKGAEWYRAYKAKFGGEPEAYAGYGYEAARVALDAIARAGVKDRDAIRAAVLATSDFDGILGAWSFDANGDTTLTAMSGRRVRSGRYDDVNAVILGAGPGIAVAPGPAPVSAPPPPDPRVAAALMPAWRALTGIERTWASGKSIGATFREIADATGVRIAVGPLPLPSATGAYRRRDNAITLNEQLLGEDARALAAVLAHELTHARQFSAGHGDRFDCVGLEVEAYAMQATVWQAFWGGYGPARTWLEQSHNRVLQVLVTQGEPGLYKLVVDTPGYREQCTLWVP